MGFFSATRPTSFVRIPLPLRGKLFVSPMPYGPYDPFNRLFKQYRQSRIERAVVLLTDEELKKKSKRNLLKIYQRSDIQVIRFPIKDLTAPQDYDLTGLVHRITEYLAESNVVVHCNAGVGRTGVVAACVVRRIRGTAGQEAIDYIKGYMMTDLTEEQRDIVLNWKE